MNKDINKKLELDFDSLVIKKIIREGIKITGVFEIKTLNNRVVYNDGQIITFDDLNNLIKKNRTEEEKYTSVLNGFFIDNFSASSAFSWGFNLHDNLTNKDKKKLRDSLKNEAQKFKEFNNFNNSAPINIDEIKLIIKQALLESLNQARILNFNNEAELKYHLHYIIKKRLIESKRQNLITLVEYKINQGNKSVAWFSIDNFGEKERHFIKGYDITKYLGFVKVVPKDFSIINSESLKKFNAQQDRTFKVDLAIINSFTGKAVFLIELKYGHNIKSEDLEGDVVKFMIYNSVNDYNVTGLAVGYIASKGSFIIRSNNETIEKDIQEYLQQKLNEPYLSSTEEKPNQISLKLRDTIIKIAKETLFDEYAYGSYQHFIESSWQAEFNYRLKNYLPADLRIHNEYSLTANRGRVDLAILDKNNSPRYFIEFKNHGDPKPEELVSKVFQNEELVKLFITEMQNILRTNAYDIIKKKGYQFAPKDKNGKFIYDTKFVEVIANIYSQYIRMIDLVKIFPGAVGFMFFNDWSALRSEFQLTKMKLTREEFTRCFEVREMIIKEILRADEHDRQVIFKYFNLLS